jgi:ADP-heptose:LPS heptosyltransferase
MVQKPWLGLSRMGGVGDNLMAAAVLPLLAETYQIDMVTNETYGCLYDNNPHISKVTKIREGDIPTDSMLNWQVWFAKRAHEYDQFINLSHSCEALYAFPQTQTPFYWSDAWRRKHCNKNYLDVIADICGVEPVFTQPLFYPTEEEYEKAAATKKKVGERCIGWSIAGSRLDKYHPNTPLIVARLIKELEIPVIMFGADSEREQNVGKATMEHVEKTNGSTAGLHTAWTTKTADGKSVIHEWPIRRSLAQLIACDLVIGPDTGAMWGVAFETMPKIMLLSHASRENIVKHWRNTVAPEIDTEQAPCWPCHRLLDDTTYCRPNKAGDGVACISSISTETIISEARAALNREPALRIAAE